MDRIGSYAVSHVSSDRGQRGGRKKARGVFLELLNNLINSSTKIRMWTELQKNNISYIKHTKLQTNK